jgi:hypothetical protein
MQDSPGEKFGFAQNRRSPPHHPRRMLTALFMLKTNSYFFSRPYLYKIQILNRPIIGSSKVENIHLISTPLDVTICDYTKVI